VQVVREGLERKEEKVREIRYIETEALSARISVADEVSGELKAVVLIDGGILFISGVEGGDLSFLYYPSRREEVRKEAEILTETFLSRYPDLNFLIGLEGTFSLLRGEREKHSGRGKYLIVFEGNRLILHSYGEKGEFLEIRSDLCLLSGKSSIWSGWKISGTGAYPVRSGGVTGFPSGTVGSAVS